MAQIIPFRGTLYDPAAVGSIRDVVAPPYDIIDAAGQKALYDRHPQNIIRLELGIDQPGDNGTNNRYTRAGETLGAWINGGALKRDAQPAIYYHTIEYTPPSSDARAPKKTLRGFLTTTKLETYDTLGRAFTLFRTLSGLAKLDAFEFVTRWPSLSDAEKRAKYGEFACHELHFFLSKKDPAFFKAVIQPCSPRSPQPPTPRGATSRDVGA